MAGYATVGAEVCVKEFGSLSDITNESANGVPVTNRLFVFPNINFICKTRVLKWTFAATIQGVVVPSRELPQMQVWREDTDRYRRQFSTGNGSEVNITTNATDAVDRMLIYYTLNETVTVEVGDVFGMFVPGGANPPRYSPLFLDLGAGNASSYFYISEAQSSTQNLLVSALEQEAQYVPLVAVEYG